MNKIKTLFLFSIITLIIGCQKDDKPSPLESSKKTSEYKSLIAQEWMTEAYIAVKDRGFFALDASRLYAYTSITMYESMVHGIPNGASLNNQLVGLTTLPQPDPNKQYDWGIVICHATPKILIHMLKEPSVNSRRRLELTGQIQERKLLDESPIDPAIVATSKEFADQLVAAIIQYADSDGTTELLKRSYTMPPISENPSFYDGNGTPNPFFMAPYWWTSRTLATGDHKLCESDPPYAYSEDPNNIYYKEVKEVLDATRDPEKLRIGQFWANNPGVSGTPAGSWVGIANQLVTQFNLDIITTLKMYVLLTISTRDTFISVWHTKYKWNLQRPVSFIRKVLGEPNWLSPVPTPPYPDYVSGTSANAGSSSEILTNMFGYKSFTDGQHDDKGFGIRRFETFKDAGREAYHSRIYAGVHMRKACEEGFELGECVAQHIMAKLKFSK